MSRITDTRYTPWVYTEGRQGCEKEDHGIKAYRIWMETDGRSWWQRHEWLYHDGSQWKEPWINTCFTQFPKHYIAISEQDKE